MNYSNGSEWRKWDLHIHTPLSHKNNYNGKDLNEKWEKFITDLESLPAEFKVLGINDYLFIDGYEKVLEYKSKGRLKNIDTIFPVIEFRIKKFGGHKEFKRVNFHVIFSDKLNPNLIRQQFLNQLYGKYKLAPGFEGLEWAAAITPDSLADLGKAIKSTLPPEKLHEYGSDIEEGFNNINFDEEEMVKLLTGSSYLKNNFITAIGKTEWDAFKWDDSSIAEKKTVINRVDFVFTSSETIDAYKKAKEKLTDQKVNNLLFDCSDAHNNSNSTDKDRIGKCFTWVKADTTFEGLKQVINESDRLFVGGKPPLLERLTISPKKFIKRLCVQKVAGSSISESWYDNFNIEINPSLVAIIGNKGNGKSALTDILGLTGNSYNEAYSFLTKVKFRNPRPFNKALNFEAQIEWQDGSFDGFINLNSNIDINKPEKVKYIPQNFLEALCVNEDEYEFEKEIKKIIFSHTQPSDRLGHTNLDELIAYKSEIINKEICTIKGELDDINQKIIQLERKQNQNYRQSLEEGLNEKEEELKNCNLLKPAPVEEPKNNQQLEEKNKELNKRIAEVRIAIDQKAKDLEVKIRDKGILQQDLAELERIRQIFEATKSNVDAVIESQAAALDKFDIRVEQVFNVQLNVEPINKLIGNKTDNLTQLNNDIFGAGDKKSGLQNEIIVLRDELASIEQKLDEPYRIYQKYIQDLQNWEKRKSEIVGAVDKPETIEYYKHQLKYLDEKLQEDIQSDTALRERILEKLFEKKSELVNLYKSSYKPITDFIEKYGHLMSDYKINLSVELTLEGFSQKFFDHISQGAKGTYIGIEEGNKFLSNLIPQFNINEKQGFINFLTNINQSLFFDKKADQDNEPRDIEKQLKKGYSIEDLYRFLYYADYVKPAFRLNLGDKSLSTLSPGERGALLLIFYLFLDTDDKPLIIDQPEENLDNQSVYKYLVHFIKEAKQKRQIIMITHNPNLAVVCDAEQIIHMSIDKVGNHKVSAECGAIENPVLNRLILDILEGTKPAFANRTNKYSLTV